MDQLHLVLSAIATRSKNTIDIESGFAKAAKLLLLDYKLVAGDADFEILELEFYFYQKDVHPDPYSHAFQYPNRVIPKMSVTGSWYFHRFIGIEKYTHTRRGLDLTYGSGELKAYGGLLIRSVKRESDGKLISGPSNVMAKVLEAADNPQAIQKLAFNLEEGMAFRPDSVLRLVPREEPVQKPLFKTKRQGLGDKNLFYRDKEYRFFSELSVIKKTNNFNYNALIIM